MRRRARRAIARDGGRLVGLWALPRATVRATIVYSYVTEQ